MTVAPPQTSPVTDPAHDLLRTERKHPLDVFFAPRNVALIGATEMPGSVGRTLLTNLIASPFGGTVFPVNPKRPSVLGIKAYPNVAAVPDKIDLAVIVTPAPTVPGIIGECVAAGVQGAIIISAGFKETGPVGAELERQVLELARAADLRIVGPNCLGVMSPLTGLNATFAQAMARPGRVAFLSQSGALLTAVLDVALREQIGFSAFASLGSMLDVGWGDLIDYLGDDPKTDAIVIYMESIGDARAFLSAAREVALSKPIIVIKAGRTDVGAKAAASHTGSLTGSDEVLDAAFARCGVLRVRDIADIFSLAEVLAKQPRPRGPRLTILTNAGGPGVLAADALIEGGGQLAPLSPATMDALNAFLPPAWSHNNPIDVLGDAPPERYARALEVAARDEESDGLLVILTPQAMTDPTQTAEQLRPYAKIENKPVLAAWMGGASVAAGETLLNGAGVAVFPYPDQAARAFTDMVRYSDNLRALYEVSTVAEAGAAETDVDSAAVHSLIEQARRENRTLLTEPESKAVLAAYGIPTIETVVAKTPDEAVRAAERIGYPVVVKLYSRTITHKTDVNGVHLNLPDAESVRRAFTLVEQGVRERAGEGHLDGVTVQPMIRLGDGYELILGASLDPQFGPVLLFGAGGQLVEVFKDRALGLPPLTAPLARRLMERTRIFTALQGVRGRPPVDIAALEQVLVHFSRLIAEHRFIKEMDINPLLASPTGFVALDARVVLHGPDVTDQNDLPRLAVRPYPTQYATEALLKDGEEVTIRPIRPEDEPLLSRFHQTLSERSVFLRYFQPLKLGQRVAHERLTRICMGDFDRDMALVAARRDPTSGEREILAVGRLSRLHHGSDEARFALLVSDQHQRRGLGTLLLKNLLDAASGENIRRVIADVLGENEGMQRICRALGFTLSPHPTDAKLVRAEVTL